MLKAPEKFLDEYLSHEKETINTRKPNAILSKTPRRTVSEEQRSRLRQSLQTLWGIYGTPEIKEILAKKKKIRFLNVESSQVCLSLCYVDKGISMEYELDLGIKQELAGARVYKQSETMINRYCSTEKGTDSALDAANSAIQALVDVLVEKDILETDIWNAIAKGAQFHPTVVVYPS
ncbi:MAG: hypothetical protein HZB37_08230 [Planctomycetes bacterium]|nr:hypothetical protein [Planctomycetota bacterium]